MLKQAVDYAAAQQAAQAPDSPPEYVDARPRPFDPTPTSLKACLLLAVRQSPEGIDTSHACMAGLKLFQQQPGKEKAARSFAQLRKVLSDLLWAPMPPGLEATASYVARQQPFPIMGDAVESTWTAVETPYWKPGDVPRIVRPARKKPAPYKRKPKP